MGRISDWLEPNPLKRKIYIAKGNPQSTFEGQAKIIRKGRNIYFFLVSFSWFVFPGVEGVHRSVVSSLTYFSTG